MPHACPHALLRLSSVPLVSSSVTWYHWCDEMTQLDSKHLIKCDSALVFPKMCLHLFYTIIGLLSLRKAQKRSESSKYSAKEWPHHTNSRENAYFFFTLLAPGPLDRSISPKLIIFSWGYSTSPSVAYIIEIYSKLFELSYSHRQVKNEQNRQQHKTLLNNLMLLSVCSSLSVCCFLVEPVQKQGG